MRVHADSGFGQSGKVQLYEQKSGTQESTGVMLQWSNTTVHDGETPAIARVNIRHELHI